VKKTFLILILLVTSWLVPLAPAANAAAVSRPFTDIGSANWAYGEIEKLQQNSLINGYADGSFKPNKTITRAEAVKILIQAENIPLPKSSVQSRHSDVPANHWAVPYIEAASQYQIVKGYADGTFRPGATLTRGDIAVLLVRTFDLKDTAVTPLLPSDVSSRNYASSSISKLISNGITERDSEGKFYPAALMTRSEFAVMLARTMYPEFRIGQTAASAGQAAPTAVPADATTNNNAASSILPPVVGGIASGSGGPPSGGSSSAGGPGSGVPSSPVISSPPRLTPIPPPAPDSTNEPTPAPTPNPVPTTPESMAEVTGLHGSSDDTSITLSWTNPDNANISQVHIYSNGTPISKITGTTYTVEGLTPSTPYMFTVRTIDSNNTESAGTSLEISTAPALPPAPPANVVATPLDESVALEWTDTSPTSVNNGYNVYVDGEKFNRSTVTQTAYQLDGLTNGREYKVTIATVNQFNTESQHSDLLCVTPMAKDIQAPDEVQQLEISDDGTWISFKWLNPADPDFETAEIYQDDVLVGNSRDGTFTAAGVLQETTYKYTIKTVDTSQNASRGITMLVTTKDITPPDVPRMVTTSENNGFTTISWQPNSEKDLAGYNIYVNNTKWNTHLINGSSYEISNLDIGNTYAFKVEAVDTSGNLSGPSEESSLTVSRYMVNLGQFGIYNDGSHPVQTTSGISAALQWAYEQQIKTVSLPPGTYLIDKNSQINMVPNMTLDLTMDVVFQKETNDKEKYQIMALNYGDDNVTIKGGTFIGDKLTHDYSKKSSSSSAGTHEFGYGIIAEGVKNLTIDGIKATNFTGDGIILAGHGTMRDMYEKDFVSGAIDSNGQPTADSGKTRTKNMIQLTNPIFQKEPYFELMNASSLPGTYDIYLYKADGTLASKLSGKKMRDIIDIPDGVTQFHLVFASSSYKGAYLEMWNRALTRDSVIMNSESAFNRRQGISIVGADRITIKNNLLHDIKGIAPESGIDLEGGYGENGDLVTNITIQNNKFYNNNAYDLILYDGHDAIVEGNHFASSGKIGLAISAPFRNAFISNNHFDGARLLASHDAKVLNNRLNDSVVALSGPNVIVDGLEITNGLLSSSVTVPFGTSVSNVKITITKNVEAGISLWSQPIRFTNVTITGQGSNKVISGGVAEGSIFDNLSVLDYDGKGLVLPPGTYTNSTFRAAEGSTFGSVYVAAGKYVFDQCTFNSNTTGAVPFFAENADLDLTIRNSTFNQLGDATAISIQAAKSVLLENNTINATAMKRTDLPLIAINDYWKRNDSVDVMAVTLSGNTIKTNIAGIGISTIYAGTGAPSYKVINNILEKALINLKTNDLNQGNILK